MERLTLPGAGIETSRIGFGCASLGSRVAPMAGREALEAAFAAGVTWYDVAPAYGAGEAEAILGDFLKDKADRVQLCTKVGLAPPRQGAAKKALRAVLRPALAVAAPLRAAIRKSGATANTRVPLTPELIATSLERSLARLGVGQVALYALHNAEPADLARDDVLRALEDIRRSGKARAVAVAGAEPVARAAIDAATASGTGSGTGSGGPVQVVQLAQPSGPGDLFDAAAAAGIGTITHSVFGVAGALAALGARLRADPDAMARLREAGFGDSPETAAATLLRVRALTANRAGVILMSMFSDRSRQQNLAPVTPAQQAALPGLCAALGL